MTGRRQTTHEALQSAHIMLAAQSAVLLGRQLLPPSQASVVGDCLAKRFLTASASDIHIHALLPVAALQPASPRAPPQPGSASDSAASAAPSAASSPAAATLRLLSFCLGCLNRLPGTILPSRSFQQAKRPQSPMQRSITQKAPVQFCSSPRPAAQPVTNVVVEDSSLTEQEGRSAQQEARPGQDSAVLLLSKLRLKLRQRDYEEVVRLFSEDIAAEVNVPAVC